MYSSITDLNYKSTDLGHLYTKMYEQLKGKTYPEIYLKYPNPVKQTEDFWDTLYQGACLCFVNFVSFVSFFFI